MPLDLLFNNNKLKDKLGERHIFDFNILNK